MKKVLMAALAALATGAAHADRVYWSIGINAPNIGTVISNSPRNIYLPPPPVVYAQPQVVYTQPPVIVAPAPQVIYDPRPFYHTPPQVLYQPPVVIQQRPYRPHRHHHRGWDDDRGPRYYRY